MSKKVEVQSSVRSSYVPFSSSRVAEIWDSNGNVGKGVGETDEEALANARSAYTTATKPNSGE